MTRRARYPKTAGALSGLAAGAAGASVLWLTGALSPLRLAMNLPEWLVLPVWLAMEALLGAIYAHVFGRGADSAAYGWLVGAAYGLVLWLIGPVALVGWTASTAAAPASAAVGLAVAWLVYGLVLGLLYPHIHERVRRARAGD